VRELLTAHRTLEVAKQEKKKAALATTAKTVKSFFKISTVVLLTCGMNVSSESESLL
jgi:hypothetical protein